MSLNQDPDEGRDDPANWIWGIFYFNPKDKRIFPPKKDKYAGWTVNFANPVSIGAMIALLAAMFLITNSIRHL